METLRKRLIVQKLIAAMEHEDLNTRATAQLLNLNPAYVSMAKNEKSWPAMGAAPWARLDEWANSMESLKAFVIPEGEAIWQPAPKKTDPEKINITSNAGVLKPEDTAVEPVHKKKARGKGKKIDENPVEKWIDAAADKIWQRLEEMLANASILPPPIFSKSSTENTVIRQGLALDIEINLVVNGNRVRIG